MPPKHAHVYSDLSSLLVRVFYHEDSAHTAPRELSVSLDASFASTQLTSCVREDLADVSTLGGGSSPVVKNVCVSPIHRSAMSVALPFSFASPQLVPQPTVTVPEVYDEFRPTTTTSVVLPLAFGAPRLAAEPLQSV